MIRKFKQYSWFILLFLILDQVTKLWIKNHLINNKSIIKITSFFELVFVYNKGVSFGMFNSWRYSSYLFSIITIVALIIFFIWFCKNKSGKIIDYSLIMIITGGLGNLIDRFYHGAVIDFLSFHYKDWYWPAFNIADSLITIGVILMFLEGFFVNKRR